MVRYVTYVAVGALVGVLMVAIGSAAPMEEAQGAAQPGWVMTDLGTLGGSFSTASDINGRGQVVGTSRTVSGERHAFLWQDGKMTDLGVMARDTGDLPWINERSEVVWNAKGDGWVVWRSGATRRLGFVPASMNNRGQIVGTRYAETNYARGVLWQNGRTRDLGSFQPAAINDSGVTAGAIDPYRPRSRAFLWRKGVMRALGTLRGFPNTVAFAINRTGQVLASCNDRIYNVGHVCIWEKGRMRDLRPGSRHSFPIALNDHGAVVMSATVGDNQHAFVWVSGKATDLGTLGGQFTLPTAIDSTGRIVGASPTAARKQHAFVWEDGVMTDLAREGLYARSKAYALNSKGQIVGESEIGKPKPRPGGRPPSHAVIWTRGPM